MGTCGTADIECFLLACAGRQCDSSHLYHAYAIIHGAVRLFLLFLNPEMAVSSHICAAKVAFQAGRAYHSHDFFWLDQDCLRFILDGTYSACCASISQVLIFLG